MLKTPDDMFHDALETISDQCRRMFESASEMNTEQLKAENEVLQKSIEILGIIERYIMKGGATA